MDDLRQFWGSVWDEGRLGFHRDQPDTFLVAHHDRLSGGRPRRVLVPLCGKTPDVRWLAAQGHDVVGVELVPKAVAQFHSENELTPEIDATGPFVAHRTERLTILCGDFLAVSPEVVGTFDAVWDRAALVALPPVLRVLYAAALRSVLAPGADVLLVTFEYDQERLAGPPFSVPEAEVRDHFGGWAAVEPVLGEDILHEAPRFRERGLTWLEQHVWHLRVQ